MQHLRLLMRQRSRVMVTVCMFLLIAMSLPARAADNTQTSDSYDFDILYVNWGPDKDHVSVFLEPRFMNEVKMAIDEPKFINEVKIYEHYMPQNSIQWALAKARVVVVTDGRYEITEPNNK